MGDEWTRQRAWELDIELSQIDSSDEREAVLRSALLRARARELREAEALSIERDSDLSGAFALKAAALEKESAPDTSRRGGEDEG